MTSLALSLGACGGAGDGPVDGDAPASAGGGAGARYNREYLFVASRSDGPVVAPFTFRAVEVGDQLERTALGWLARGGTWERFIEETTTTTAAGGFWRIVPQGNLHLIAGGPAEIEAIRFHQGERRLRLDLEGTATDWNQGGETRFRILEGRLSIGPEILRGYILEVLRVERTLEDGWPPSEDFDALFLVGPGVQIVLADPGATSTGPSYGWIRAGGAERSLNDAEIRWIELRPMQEARRDVPRRWSFQVPGSTIVGELEAVGSDAMLGPERGGRRAVEIRFSVQGWVQIEEERVEVSGMIRHTQQ